MDIDSWKVGEIDLDNHETTFVLNISHPLEISQNNFQDMVVIDLVQNSTNLILHPDSWQL